ncbi:LysR family transcriptional regulator [Azorhizobium caulinodans]|uniref:LysR family transcriptional regulator n=1 Tax=Azorhizobium caulinodans TaxID=7 RepID=UPI002FBDD826
MSAFVAVARHKSFTRAADALGLSRSSLSHTVKGLERQLDKRLLHRTTRSVALTEAGERLLLRIIPVLAELETALDSFGEEHNSVSGTLRINASDTAARMMMSRAVPAFLARHPKAALELIVDRGFVDIVKQGFDAGVRFLGAVPEDMVAVPFGAPVRFVAVAAPDYLRLHGVPQSPEDLHQHQCIRQRMPSGRIYRWEFRREEQELVVDVPSILTMNDNGLMLEAAACGLGIAYVPEHAVRHMLEAGGLVAVLEAWTPPPSIMNLYYARHRYVPATLRAFIDILTER